MRPVAPDGNNQTDWDTKDNKALADIVLSMKPSQLQHIKNCNTSKQAWDKLHDVYSPKGATSKVHLTKKLLSLRMTDKEDMKDHTNKFINLCDKLAELGITMPEEVKVILLLVSLPDSYEMLTVAIENRERLPQIDELCLKLIEEMRLSSKKEENGNSEMVSAAFVTNNKKNYVQTNQSSNKTSFKYNKKNKFPFKCNVCGIPGHKGINCFKRKDKEKSENTFNKVEHTAI